VIAKEVHLVQDYHLTGFAHYSSLPFVATHRLPRMQ